MQAEARMELLEASLKKAEEAAKESLAIRRAADEECEELRVSNRSLKKQMLDESSWGERPLSEDVTKKAVGPIPKGFDRSALDEVGNPAAAALGDASQAKPPLR